MCVGVYECVSGDVTGSLSFPCPSFRNSLEKWNYIYLEEKKIVGICRNSEYCSCLCWRCVQDERMSSRERGHPGPGHTEKQS